MRFIVGLAAFVALAAWIVAKAFDEGALEQCRLLEREAHQYGDVNVPDWCSEVPGFRQ